MQFNITVSDSAWPYNYKFELLENVTNSSIYLEDPIKITKNYIFDLKTKPGIYRLNLQVFFVFASIKVMKINGPSHVDFEIKSKRF